MKKAGHTTFFKYKQQIYFFWVFWFNYALQTSYSRITECLNYRMVRFWRTGIHDF